MLNIYRQTYRVCSHAVATFGAYWWTRHDRVLIPHVESPASIAALPRLKCTSCSISCDCKCAAAAGIDRIEVGPRAAALTFRLGSEAWSRIIELRGCHRNNSRLVIEKATSITKVLKLVEAISKMM